MKNLSRAINFEVLNKKRSDSHKRSLGSEYVYKGKGKTLQESEENLKRNERKKMLKNSFLFTHTFASNNEIKLTKKIF